MNGFTLLFSTMYLDLSLLYLATLVLSVMPRALCRPSTPSFLPYIEPRSQTTSPTPSSSTAPTSGSNVPNVVSQSQSSTSLLPSSPNMFRSSTPSSCLSLPSTPLPSSVSPQTQQDMNTILQRRLGFITASATQVSQIASWYVIYVRVFSYTPNPDALG